MEEVYADRIKNVTALPDIDSSFVGECKLCDEPEERRRSLDRSCGWPDDRPRAHDVRLGVAFFRLGVAFRLGITFRLGVAFRLSVAF